MSTITSTKFGKNALIMHFILGASTVNGKVLTNVPSYGAWLKFAKLAIDKGMMNEPYTNDGKRDEIRLYYPYGFKLLAQPKKNAAGVMEPGYTGPNGSKLEDMAHFEPEYIQARKGSRSKPISATAAAAMVAQVLKATEEKPVEKPAEKPAALMAPKVEAPKLSGPAVRQIEGKK